MSRTDFAPEEFAARRRAVGEAIAAAGLDWLVAFHPVSIHWMTGSDAKSYQEFQCLLVPAGDGSMTILTREGEVEIARRIEDGEIDSLASGDHRSNAARPSPAVLSKSENSPPLFRCSAPVARKVSSHDSRPARVGRSKIPSAVRSAMTAGPMR